MLISCPECLKQVSDKACTCPQCGYPLQVSHAPVVCTRRKKKYKKLPNGFGSIQKLSGNRRRPYAAYPPTKDFHLNGSPVRQEALGYYSTWYAAYEVLSDYNRLTEQEREELKKKNDVRSLTFCQVYEMYYKDKFKQVLALQAEGQKVKKPSLMYSTESAYKNSSALHDRIFSTLRKNDFQSVVDSCSLKHSSKELLVLLFNQMSKFALQNDYIDKDYAQFVRIDTKDDDEQGQPFSVDAIQKLWCDKEDPASQMILILIYTGFRISAFKDMIIDLENGYFQGGVKTAAGKNRLVPIHSAILGFIPSNPFLKSFSPRVFRQNYFYKKLSELGIDCTLDGTKHTPHDCRHTFSWLCDHFGVNETSKHMLMGHALKGDVENKVYSHRTLDELKAEIEKIKLDLS